MNFYGSVVVEVHTGFTSIFSITAIVDATFSLVLTVTFQQVWGGRKGEKRGGEGRREEREGREGGRKGEKRGGEGERRREREGEGRKEREKARRGQQSVIHSPHHKLEHNTNTTRL